MDPLLLVTGILLLIAGLLSLRSGTTLGILVPILALAQIVVGIAASMAGLAFRLRGWGGPAVAVGSFTLILASACWQGARQHAVRRMRNSSEGARLETYVKYLSRGPSGG